MLKAIPALKACVDDSLFMTLASVMEENVFDEGDDVCVSGEDQGILFVIYEGTCKLQDEDDDSKELAKGDWIGDKQLIENIDATETLVVASENAVILTLEYDNFCCVAEATKSLRHTKAEEHRSEGFRDTVTRVMARIRSVNMLSQSMTLKGGSLVSQEADIRRCDVVGALGEGSFGLVLLLRDRTTQREFALKAMRKEYLRNLEQEDMVKNERRLMMLSDSDFVVHLHKSYEDSGYLFLLLDAVHGGELFDVFIEQGFWGRVGHARFYIGNVALGLAHLHSKRIVYRDLKLENCLVDAQGYLKLTDLGIAKMVIGKTFTVCGTADYFAPETLRQLGHNRAADWWACGVLLFIMIVGRSPFDAPEVPQIYKNIIKGMSKVEFPRSCPSDAKNVILSLCRKKPEDRVTMQKGGFNNFKAMHFFEPLCWDDLAARRFPAAYVPPQPDYDRIAKRKLSCEVDINWQEVREWCDDEADKAIIDGQEKGAVAEDQEAD